MVALQNKRLLPSYTFRWDYGCAHLRACVVGKVNVRIQRGGIAIQKQNDYGTIINIFVSYRAPRIFRISLRPYHARGCWASYTSFA